jgi:cell division protein ZapA (FtsZ GTPase activity inhibitor)
MLSVAYGNAALVATINLAVELGAVKSELQAVRNANSRLEAELNTTRSTLAKAMAKHEEDCTYVLDQLELLKRKIK